MNAFMECDELYYGTDKFSTSYFIICKIFINKLSGKINHNGERVLLLLKNCKLHHTFNTKQLVDFKKYTVNIKING